MNQVWPLGKLRILLPGMLLLMIGLCAPALAVERTFPAGSLVIPVDPCWQPAQEQPAWTGCAADGTTASVAGAYGVVYLLQRSGVPVYQAGPAEGGGIAFVIHGQGLAPVIELPAGQTLAPVSRITPDGRLPENLLDYRRAPFLIDHRDLTPEALAQLERFPRVRRHQALVPFVAPVTRQLTGLPDQLIVADAVAVERVEELLALAGMSGSSGVNVVTAEDTSESGARLDCTADTPPAAPQEGLCGLEAIFTVLVSVPTTTVPEETVEIAPLISAGTLYIASANFPGRDGHLRGFALSDSTGNALWDAAEGVPGVGSEASACSVDGSLQPPFAEAAGERLIFTNADVEENYRLLRFDACAAAALAPSLGSADVEPARTLIETVRSAPLGAITSSTPAVVGTSPFVASGLQRERVLYVGRRRAVARHLGRKPGAGGRA